ncbi:hypothetical protein GJ496_008177 [Pomphorhynchus laevis]|nr:hypothetical protein GJ496_008177 [Pomphorhynchus laevis]
MYTMPSKKFLKRLVNNDAENQEVDTEDACSKFFNDIQQSVAYQGQALVSDSDNDSLLDYNNAIDTTSDEDDDLGNVGYLANRDHNLETFLESDEEKKTDKNEENQIHWGDFKDNFYHKNRGEWDTRGNDDIELEESEALLQQHKLLELLDEDVFIPSRKNKFMEKSSDPNRTKTLPEMQLIIKDLKSKIKLIEQKLKPVLSLTHLSAVTQNIIQRISTFYNFYCSTAFLFLVIRSNQKENIYHPIVNNMLNLRKINEKVEPYLEVVLNMIDNIKEVECSFLKSKRQSKKKDSPWLEELSDSTDDSDEDSKFDNEISVLADGTDTTRKTDDEIVSVPADDIETKRKVGDEIMKNKPNPISQPSRKKKLTKNPRSSLKRKFQKALIRRKSQVPEIRSKNKPYDGERTGIKTNIKRSIKLK